MSYILYYFFTGNFETYQLSRSRPLLATGFGLARTTVSTSLSAQNDLKQRILFSTLAKSMTKSPP